MRIAPYFRPDVRRPARMRPMLLAATACVAFSGPAIAEEIAVTSQITEATLFPDGATVTREATFEAPIGRHVIILEDAPAALDPATLRIEGDAESGGFTILSTERGSVALEPSEEQNEERRRLEDEIEEAEWRQRAAEDRYNLTQERLQYLRRFRDSTAQAPSENAGGAALLDMREGWRDAWRILNEESASASAELRDAEREILAVREEIAALRRELSLVGPATPTQTVLKVTIDAEAPVEGGRLEIDYLTDQASWRPLYDLRLIEDEDEIAEGSVNITRRAAIRQNTGENWVDIRVTLSTARPSQRLAGQIPTEIVAQIREEPLVSERYDAPTASSQGRVIGGYGAVPSEDADEAFRFGAATRDGDDMGLYELDDALSVGEAAIAPQVERRREAAEQAGASARVEGERVVYELDERQTITGDGSTSFALIDEDAFDARLEARAAPAIEETAYLTAIMTIDDALPPGVASVYRGDAYLGQARLAYVGPGDEAELPFGVVEGLRIEHELVERVRGGEDSAFDSSTTVRERYLIRAANLTDEALPVVIYAAAPVSEDERITLETTTTPDPEEDRVDGRRNVYAWRFELDAAETSEITYGWDLAWPEDEAVIFQAR